MKASNKHFYAVIMAGGGGTRLWPMSRNKKPKQLLQLAGERSLFQMAVDRLRGLFPIDRIYVVTSKELSVEFMRQSPELKKKNLILEPLPKGTAAAVGLAASILHAKDEDAIMAVLTADHIIRKVKQFQKCLMDAHILAAKGYLVTLGIRPTSPNTGYGYIQKGKSLQISTVKNACRVLRFKEKPDEKSAKAFLKKGDHLWNSGMFIWKADVILKEFYKLMPGLSKKLLEVIKVWNSPNKHGQLVESWKIIKPETIDYGIMEHAQNVVVLETPDFGWSDLGSWDSIYKLLKKDTAGNAVLAKNIILKKTSGSLLIQEDPEKMIATLGLDDIIVIESGDALLICRRELVTDIKSLVDEMKLSGKYQRYT